MPGLTRDGMVVLIVMALYVPFCLLWMAFADWLRPQLTPSAIDAIFYGGLVGWLLGVVFAHLRARRRRR